MYTVKHDHRVIKHDIPKLSETVRQRVRRAIAQKLTTHPELYGLTLRRDLKGFRKLRVGDYRIIFRIERTTVIVLSIKHRSVVYEAILKRLSRLDRLD